MPLEKIENMQSHLDNSDNSLGLGDLVLLDMEQNMRVRVVTEVSGVSIRAVFKSSEPRSSQVSSL